MFDPRLCLNPNHPDVKKWIDNVGKENMYKVFVQNNYLLPDYNSYKGAEEVFSKNIEDYKKFLDKLLPSNQYEFDVLDSLKNNGFNILGTAAFFQKTFYFKNRVTKNELAEEAFHAIVQTLMNEQERTQIYNGGRELLNQRLKKEKRNFNDYISELEKLFPNVSKETLEQFAYEEEIAKDFVNYYNSEGKTNRYSQERINSIANKLSILGKNALPIAELIHRFFERIKALFNLTSNQKEVEMLFKKISNGEYRNTKIVNNNDNIIPSFAVYTNANDKIIPSDEISQMKRAIAVLAKNLFESDGVKLTQEQAINQAIENYIGFLENQLNKVSDDKVDLINDLINLLYNEDEELIQEITDQFEANKTIFDEIENDQIENKEDEVGSNERFEDNANQQSPESRNKELKILMNTTGTIQGRIYVDSTGKTQAYQDLDSFIITDVDGNTLSEEDIKEYKKIYVLKIADEKLIYSAIVRKLSNISDEKKRFIELVKLSMYNPEVQAIKGKQDNENTKTFVNTLLKDILGDSKEETKKNLLEDLKGTDSLSDIIKADTKPLHIQRFLLALRGFNLASRNVYRVEIDLEKGWGKFLNVDASSKKTVQKTFWDSNYRLQQDKSYQEFKNLFNENYKLFNKEYVNQNKNIVNLAKYYNNLLELLGVDVNGEYLLDFMTKIVNENYPLLYTNKVFTIDTLKERLEAIKLKLNEKTEYPDLYKGDDEEIEVGVPKEKDVDFNSFFNFIAEGNVEFDERVIESSYKDGYGNSIYNHQLPTFTLKFGNSFKTIEDFTKLQEGGIIGVDTKLDENGKVQLIKSKILDSFKKDNPLVDDLSVNGEVQEERLKKLNIYTLDTTQLKSFNQKRKGGYLIEKDSEYSTDNTIGLDVMSGAEYALTNMIIYTEGAKKFIDSDEEMITAPVSLGHNEASKQIDYFTIFHDKEAITLNGELGEKSKKRIAKLIKTEYDKIRENSALLKEQILALRGRDSGFNEGEITRNNLYDLTTFTDLKTFNVYENYNVGEYEKIGDYFKAKNKKGLKGIQFSPEVEPFVNDEMLAKALQDIEFDEKDIKFNTVMEFLNEEYKILQEYDILDKLPYALRESYYDRGKYISTKGENTNEIQLFDEKLSQENRVKSFLLNYWLGSTMSNRMRYGSHNFNFKIDSTDPLKRYRMFNGATLSAKTSIINKELGINEPITHITYGTIAEPKGISDIDPESKPIDRADAAMRATPEGIRRILHGMSKLNRKISDVLDKREQGVELTPEEWNLMTQTDSYIAAMKPLAANGEQAVKTGLTSILDLKEVAYSTIIESDKLFEGKETVFYFGKDKITVDKYGRTTQLVGNTREIIWDNTNKVFKEWKAKPIDKDYILYNQRMFLRGFRKEDGVWVYKGKQYEIDTLVPPTALKTGQRNILPFVKENKISYTDFNYPKEYNDYYTFANAIDADFFGQQVENPQGKVKITSPTQNIEILANEQFGDITIKILEDGKLTLQKITNKELQEYYQKLLANRNINGRDLAVAELFTKNDKGELVPNYTYFFEKLKEGLKLTGGSGQDFEFLEVNEDGTPKYNVNIPLNKDKMIQYVLKHFSTGVLSHKVAGNSYVLASDYGMKSLKKLIAIRNNKGEIIDYTWEVVHRKTEGYNDKLVELANNRDITKYDLSDKIYDHRAWDLGEKGKSQLHTWFEEQKERLNNGKEVYFIDGLRYMKKSYIKVDGKYKSDSYTWTSEAMMPKLNAKQKSISDDIKFGTGVRIPSQDKQSAISLEWVDFLDDTLGNTIVVPKEIVQIAGSDFDIDKSYVTQYEGYWENGEYFKYKDTFEDYKKYLFKTSKPLKKSLKDKLSNNEVYQSNQTTKKELLDLRNKLFNDINFITEKEGLDLKQFKSKVNAIFEELKAIDLEENFKIRKELKEKLFEKNKNLINLNEYIKFNFQEIREINKQLDKVDENIEKEILKEQPIVLKQFNLISSEKEFELESKKLKEENENSSLNNAILNNKILDTQRALLTSDDVLFTKNENGKIIKPRGTGDTPMDLSLLEDLQKNSKVSYKKQNNLASNTQYYIGDIKPEKNTIFVFGSNPEGRHGAGAALNAKNKFGAIEGKGFGLQGDSFALPTKDLKKSKELKLYSPAEIKKFAEEKLIPYYKNNPFSDVINNNPFERSISPKEIVESIKLLYSEALNNPTKQFKVAFGEGVFGYTLNGYLHGELIEMFNNAGEIPSNVIFSKEWFDTGLLKINNKTQTDSTLATIKSIYGEGVKIEQDENNFIVYPFIQNGKEILTVEKNKKIPHNALTVHSNYQQGTIIARRGIGVTVNGLLQAIVANRIQLRLTDNFNFTYNGKPLEFTYTDSRGNRVFAVKNTLVSAATDEAKEEQLKRHGIKGDDLNVIDMLTNFGFSIDEAIALVNSKLVKKYKNTVTKNNLNKNQKKTPEQIEFDSKVQELRYKTAEINLTQNEIFEGLYEENEEILATYLKLSDMAKELAKVAKLIKGKKGYTKGKLSELTDIENTAKQLGLIKTFDKKGVMLTPERTGFFDWSDLDSNKAADIKSFVEITQDLTTNKLNQMFFEYETISKELKDTVLIDTNNPENTELSDKIEKDVSTFLISQMIKEQEKSEDPNVRSKYKYLNEFLNINKLNPSNKVDNFLDDFFAKKKESKNGSSYKLLKHLLGVKGKVNTIKNSESVDSIRLASISKLNPAQQDNIRNLFLELMYSDNADENIRNEEKLFAQNLFAYFVLKDGLQFRQFNISKIFPTEMFKDISNVLNDFKTYTKNLDNEKRKQLNTKFKQLWYSDIRNKKYRQKLKESNIFKVYRIKDKEKSLQTEFKVGEHPLYVEIYKNGSVKDYNNSNIKFDNINDNISLTLPQYFDYNGYSFKMIKSENENYYTYIREPYYGSTIIDMMVDSGVIPAASEVVGKNGSKLADLIEQLKEENTKKGYIQYYENLLLNRYSPNFDKNYKLEVDKKPVRNPNIVEKLKQFEDIPSLLEAFNKLTPEQKVIYKDDFSNRKLELPQETQSEVVGNTIEYTPKGKETQTYTIIGNKIYNKNNQEVFSEDSVDRNKIFANLDVKQGKAVVVNYKNTNYVVNNKNQIISTVSGKIMEWEENNGNRIDILKLAKDKFESKNKPLQKEKVELEYPHIYKTTEGVYEKEITEYVKIIEYIPNKIKNYKRPYSTKVTNLDYYIVLSDTGKEYKFYLNPEGFIVEPYTSIGYKTPSFLKNRNTKEIQEKRQLKQKEELLKEQEILSKKGFQGYNIINKKEIEEEIIKLADGFIGEIYDENSLMYRYANDIYDNLPSVKDSGFEVGKLGGKYKVSKEVPYEVYKSSNKSMDSPFNVVSKFIMLGRSSEFENKPLLKYTKEEIYWRDKDGAEFYLIDNNVNKEFIEYLKEINARYTLFTNKNLINFSNEQKVEIQDANIPINKTDFSEYLRDKNYLKIDNLAILNYIENENEYQVVLNLNKGIGFTKIIYKDKSYEYKEAYSPKALEKYLDSIKSISDVLNSEFLSTKFVNDVLEGKDFKTLKFPKLNTQDKPYKAGESEKERNSINDLFDEEYTNGCDNLNE